MKRRSLLRTVFGLSFVLPIVGTRRVARGVSAMQLQENDLFVFAFGERENQPIGVGDVPLGGPQVVAYPMDPETRTPRRESRLNQVILVRLDAGTLTDETRARAVDGIVAYSAVCTHTGCDVTDWRSENQHFKCPCHESEFDPSDNARVIGGPAPRRLPALPLKQVDGLIVAAGGFLSRVGFQVGDGATDEPNPKRIT